MSRMGRGHSLRGELPWRMVLAIIATGALLLGGYSWLNRPEPPITFADCSDPELVIIDVDDSQSVIDADPREDRMRAVRETLRLLAGHSCTGDDEVAVISFTEETAVNGPAPIGQLGPINRATGGGTDIANAAADTVDIAQQFPGHRVVAVLISDMQEQSPIPIKDTLASMDELELVVVSIGDADGSTFRLDDPNQIARRVIDVINNSRRNQ